MATSPRAPGSAGRVRYLIFGKAQLIALAVLAGLLIVCVIFSWTTRGAMADLSFLRGQGGGTGAGSQQFFVDQRPWQTAEALASLAVTAEETEYAREAERLADHEVDQAFAAVLRNAGLRARHRNLTGDALALSQKVAQLQQVIAQDQALVQSLKAESGSSQTKAKGAGQHPAGSGDLAIAEAQLGLDSDNLADAQRDLERATGDDSARIQSELAAHQESVRKVESQQQGDGQIAVLSVKRHGTLAGRIGAWFSQQNRNALLQQAIREAQDDAGTITAEHNALEAKADATAAAAKNTAVTLAGIQDRGTERQILSIDDERIQTDQQLASVYTKWASQVLLQDRIVMHLILQSVELILCIVICMILADALVRRLMAHPSLDRRQMQTMRTILEVGIQAFGVLLIVLVFFGPPQQTTTILGLATAALTIALQDYILAFLGWFFIVGKNGIRVGDWVEINDVCGEVIEIGLMNTTLLETGTLADPAHPTGRRISFINSFAIQGKYFNFSTASQWMWDEITVSVPSSEETHSIAKRIEEVARQETEENARLAEQEWKHGAHATGLSRLSAAPTVTMRPSLSGIDIRVIYVTRAFERSEVRNRLYQRMIELLQQKSGPAQLVEAGVEERA